MSGGSTDSSGADAGRALARELERLRTAHAFEVLGLGLDADDAAIRASFLRLTKRYHPSRYARMHREVVRLANEVFLLVKQAYTCLKDDRCRQKLLERLAPAAPASGRAAAVRAPARPTPGSSRRPAVRAPARAPARATPGSSRRPAATRRPAPAPRSVRGTAAPAPRAQRPSDVEQLERGLHDTVRRRSEDYEMALRMLAQGRYHDARTVFHKIAAADPKTKKYRLQMHYAWGLEHEDAGRFDEARKELERALQLDPQFKRAHEALDRLPDAKKGGGLFKKLFGR